MTTSILTPAQIDDLCIAYDAANAGKDEAGSALSEAKGELLAVIRAQGHAPASAEQTTRLEGQLYGADATEGRTIETNEDKVAALQSELSRMKKPKLFKQLFARRVSHQLVAKDAAGTLILALGNLPEAERQRILSLLAACFTVNVRAASVKTFLIKALREKEEKAAKKSRAKKGGN